MRSAMTTAGIAHDHVDDESLSRAVKESLSEAGKESSPYSLCLDVNAAWSYVLVQQEIENQGYQAESKRRRRELAAQRREQAEAAAWRQEHPELAAQRRAVDQADAAAWRQEHPDGGDDLDYEDGVIF
jgi:hypothetical protein